MSGGAREPESTQPWRAGIKLPGVQINHGRSAGSLEAVDGPARQPQRVEPEIPSTGYGEPRPTQLKHGGRHFPNATSATVHGGRCVRDPVAVVADREDRRVIAVPRPA